MREQESEQIADGLFECSIAMLDSMDRYVSLNGSVGVQAWILARLFLVIP